MPGWIQYCVQLSKQQGGAIKIILAPRRIGHFWLGNVGAGFSCVRQFF